MSDPQPESPAIQVGLDWLDGQDVPVDRALVDALAHEARAESERFVTTKKLRAIIAEAKRMEFNRQVPDDVLDRIDPLGRHVLIPVMEHYFADGKPTKPHWRCTVLVKLMGEDEPLQVIMDVPRSTLRRLPRIHAPRRTRLDPQWQQTLAIYGDLLHDVQTNPPMLGVAGSEPDQFYDIPFPTAFVEGLEPWFIEKEMLELVEHASASLDEHEFSRDDLVTQTGFAVLETPVWFDHSEFGEVPVRAFSWKPAPFEAGPFDANQVICQAWFDLEHPDFNRRQVDLGYDGRLWPGVYTAWQDGDRTEAPRNYENATPEIIEALTDLRRFTLALWLLSAQRVAVISGQKPARGLRRQAERLKLPSTVVVVRLRRPEPQHYDGEGQPVKWTHRWVVSGHWRRLEREGRIKKVWISPFIKGPEDLPLVLKDRFYKFER